MTWRSERHMAVSMSSSLLRLRVNVLTLARQVAPRKSHVYPLVGNLPCLIPLSSAWTNDSYWLLQLNALQPCGHLMILARGVHESPGTVNATRTAPVPYSLSTSPLLFRKPSAQERRSQEWMHEASNDSAYIFERDLCP